MIMGDFILAAEDRHFVELQSLNQCGENKPPNVSTSLYITRKMVPITWRASPFLVFLYLHLGGWRFQKRERGGDRTDLLI